MQRQTKLIPINGNIFAKEDPIIEKTESGIIIEIGNERHKRQNSAVIYAIDPNLETDLKVGDRVLLSQVGGVHLLIRGVEYLLLKQNQILGVLDDPNVVVGNTESDHRLLYKDDI